MRGFVAPTDQGWYQFLLGRPEIHEVNFWRPGATSFAALKPGEPFFFKLKASYDAIGGFGLFARFAPDCRCGGRGTCSVRPTAPAMSTTFCFGFSGSPAGRPAPAEGLNRVIAASPSPSRSSSRQTNGPRYTNRLVAQHRVGAHVRPDPKERDSACGGPAWSVRQAAARPPTFWALRGAQRRARRPADHDPPAARTGELPARRARRLW